jgi:hypothetical protein
MAALTTANSTEYTAYAAGGISNLVTKSWGQPVLSAFSKYTVPADTLAATCKVNMHMVPKGARVLGFIFQCDDNTAATTGTIEVGGTSATAAAAITDLSGGPVKLFIAALDTFSQTPLTADSIVSIQFASQVVDAAVVMTLTTLYVMD